ncbi:MAG: trypsin-like peptidase domain-containing protein [Clostridiaceae bacterium]
MYNEDNYSCNYDNMGRTPQHKKSKVFTYIAIILVTTMISGTAVGGFLYAKFNSQLNELKQATLNTASVLQQVEQENEELQNISTVKSSGSVTTDKSSEKLTTTALVKGSDVTAIAKKAGPSIVGIRMTVSSSRQNYFGSSGNQTAEGSGIIFKKDGYIMTNYHVVSNADPKSGTSNRTVLEVFLPDGRNAKATFVGGDSKTDLAVIKIDLNNLPVAELGDSSNLEVGELAVAIGNPLGMEFAGSVTVGVISALNRTVEMEDKTLNLIQTDAAINSGNSGGALLNSQGQVIGINSVKISASGVEGLGFAIPINDAKPVIDQLWMYGYVKGRPFIGISGSEITDTLSRYYNLPKGIYITDVTSGSAADKAGIKAEDILVSLDNKTVETLSDLDEIKGAHKAGDTVNAIIVRESNKINLKITFDEEK